jgi:predicted DNA-binding ArsR family transcriptional regulator
MDKITPEFKKVHAILISDFLKGFDLSSVLSVKLYSKEGFIPETEYSLDLDNMIISFNDSLKDIADIKIMIFLARAPYEALVEAVKKKKNYFNGNFLSTIIGMVNGKR